MLLLSGVMCVVCWRQQQPERHPRLQRSSLCKVGFAHTILDSSCFVLGLGEGVTFPVMHAMLAKWAPPLELSKMATFIYTGSTLGTIVSLPLTGIICDYLGWEAAFYIFGSCGIIWFMFWAFLVYERPEQ